MYEPVPPAFLEMQAEIRFLPPAVEFAKNFFETFPDIAADTQCLYNLQLAVSEALTNVMKHAYPPDLPGRVSLSLRREEDSVIITVTDKGLPFNPAQIPEPDLDNPQGHGLGMFFLREVMDSVTYGRSGLTNTLTLTKKLKPCGL